MFICLLLLLVVFEQQKFIERDVRQSIEYL